MKILSRGEELTLLSVWRLGENAYGVPIRKHIIKMTDEDWSIGAIYVPLDRLTKWKFLRANQGDPTSERGGRSKRFYRLTGDGYEALQQLKSIQNAMWDSLPELGFLTAN